MPTGRGPGRRPAAPGAGEEESAREELASGDEPQRDTERPRRPAAAGAGEEGSAREELRSGDEPQQRHWFEPVAAHLGAAYLRYSFTKGTVNEVDFLVAELGLEPGWRLLDVGCGPGRHAHELARRGIEVLGVDVSAEFVALATADAPAGARFCRLDARDLPFDAEFDAVISLCQGAFGLAGGPGARPVIDPDGAVLDGMARALRPGGRLALSAFSAYFQVRWLEDSDDFDAATGVNHEHTSVRDETGADADVDVWTSCFTPRELRLLADRAGLVVEGIYSVTPGAYERAAPTIDSPEFLVLARRPT